MKKFIFLHLLVMMLIVPTSVFASTSTNNLNSEQSSSPNAVNNINNNSTILETVENTRQKNSGKGFDNFMDTIRKPSIPIGISIFAFSGLLFLIGFIIKPLQKIGGTMIAGVVLGMILIHTSEYIVGFVLAIIDYVIGYL